MKNRLKLNSVGSMMLFILVTVFLPKGVAGIIPMLRRAARGSTDGKQVGA